MNVCLILILITIILFNSDLRSQVSNPETGKDTINAVIPLRNYLNNIEANSDLKFVYNDELVKGISISKSKNYNWNEDLQNQLSKREIGCKEFTDKLIVLFKSEKNRVKSKQSRVIFKTLWP